MEILQMYIYWCEINQHYTHIYMHMRKLLFFKNITQFIDLENWATLLLLLMLLMLLMLTTTTNIKINTINFYQNISLPKKKFSSVETWYVQYGWNIITICVNKIMNWNQCVKSSLLIIQLFKNLHPFIL